MEDELHRLEAHGIIEKVQEPTLWISPLVVVPKTNESVCLCLDMRRVNEAVIRERHMIPKLDELLQDINAATVFSKTDLTSGYHQLQLCEESKILQLLLCMKEFIDTHVLFSESAMQVRYFNEP